MTQRQRCGSIVRKNVIVALAALCMFVFAFSQASAQNKSADQAQQTQQAQQSQELQKAKQKAQKYSQKLRKIQKTAMENNPDLKKKRDELQNMQEKKMKEMVSDNATRMEKLKARMKLRQDKELQQKRQSLQKDFLDAMKKEDPKTQEYLDKFSNARKKIRKIQQQKRQRQQGQGQGQGGMQKQQ